jgi:methyl-accepting chemotaxis protein/HPt (histidine-containing phosphotransfer) domain-containing protein
VGALCTVFREGGLVVLSPVMTSRHAGGSAHRSEFRWSIRIMKNLTIGKRLSLGLGGIILITLGLSVYAFTRLEAVQSQALSLANDSLPGAVLMGQIAALSEREIALVLSHIKANDVQGVQRFDQELRENHEKLGSLFNAYQGTVFGTEEVERFRRLNTTYSAYLTTLEEVLKLSRVQKDQEAYALYDQQLQPMFVKFLEGANNDVNYNQKTAESSVRKLNSAAAEAKVILIAGIIVTLILAVLISYSVIRSIKQPLAKMIDLLSDIRVGDFTRRLAWPRNDEFGELADGFDRMSGDLTNLVGQVQRSALQVASSVTEIAATAREHQATSTETASATSEIGATSKEITATSKVLLKTINGVTEVAEQTANLAGTGQSGLARMEATMRLVMEAGGAVNAKLEILNARIAELQEVLETTANLRSSARPSLPADSHLPVCDERQLNELAGAEDAEDFVNEVLQIFVEQAEHLASRLPELANSPDLLSSEAHKLRGAAGCVGAARVAYFCGIVDNAAKKSSNSPIDPRAIADLTESLNVSVQEYRKRLQRK